MFYDVLMEKRATRRQVNPSDLGLAQLYQDDDDLKRRIHRDNVVMGGAVGLFGGVPAAVMVDDILKHDQKAHLRTRALSALGIPLSAAALGAYGASRLFPVTDEYVKRLRVAQDRQAKRKMEKRAEEQRAQYRDRVQVHAFADKDNTPHILASFDGKRYHFPGGGMDGASFDEAARNEMLEEAGYEIGKARIAAKPKKYVMSDKWQDQSLAKRGVRFKGVRNAIVHAELGARNTSRYGREGDQMSGLKLYPLADVANHMSWYAQRMNRYAEPNDWVREDLRAAAELQRELKQRTSRR